MWNHIYPYFPIMMRGKTNSFRRGNVAVSVNFGSSPQVPLPFTCHMVQERRPSMTDGETVGKPDEKPEKWWMAQWWMWMMVRMQGELVSTDICVFQVCEVLVTSPEQLCHWSGSWRMTEASKDVKMLDMKLNMFPKIFSEFHHLSAFLFRCSKWKSLETGDSHQISVGLHSQKHPESAGHGWPPSF